MSEVYRDKNSFLKARAGLKGTLGLVPTMGHLHRGHLELVKKSLQENDHTVVSIFVNPTQFDPGEDFESYPRNLEADKKKLDELGENLIIWAPRDPKEIYPPGFQTFIKLKPLSTYLCGKSRPNHFEGVTTVVYQLFRHVRPNRAYFGKKDYQQWVILKRMNEDLGLGVDVIGLATVREKSSLALSSRNAYLSEEQKEEALILRNSLLIIEKILKNESLEMAEKEAKKIQTDREDNWDYLEIRQASDLSRPDNQTKNFLIAGAFYIGKARLIDNIEVRID